jgi:hypothetical protein
VYWRDMDACVLRLYANALCSLKGPWNLGRFSKPIGIVAVAWVTLIIPVLCFPATKGKDLNDINMNYTCLIYGGVMLLALLWYAVDARHWFKGPKINVEHLIYTKSVEGQETESDKEGGSGREIFEDEKRLEA